MHSHSAKNKIVTSSMTESTREFFPGKRIAVHLLIIISGLFIFSSNRALAQNGIKELDVEGLKVYFRYTPKDVISAKLFVDGGTVNYPLEKQGIEALTYNLVLNGGTLSKNKVAFKSAAEKIGTFFGSEASLDYGDMSMTCIKPF
jgi:hypothetical protein